MPPLTRMMLTVRDAAEAAAAADAGVDGVEWAAPVGFDPAAVRAIRAAFPGRLRVRLQGSARDVAGLSIDEVAVGAGTIAPRLDTDKSVGVEGPALIAVLTVTGSEVEAVGRLRGHADGVMLDAGPHRLVGEGGVARLDAFAGACRRAGLPFGFSGRLEAPDIARLLLLRPDVLAFDTAVRARHEPDGALDLGAVEGIRALIPRISDAVVSNAAEHHERGRHFDDLVIKDLATDNSATDLLFVRDFITTLSIGAYRQEHGRRQRVRFSVDALVRREPVPPRDMRDVFSYDVIIETIRVLAERGHATFVETLAEEIATSLLTHAALVSITVRVEKLDVIDGAVGIEIRRGRR